MHSANNSMEQERVLFPNGDSIRENGMMISPMAVVKESLPRMMEIVMKVNYLTVRT